MAEKQLALIALVTCAFPSAIPREQLASGLWPNASSRSARHSLSQAIYQIRRKIGAPSIEVDGEKIRLGDIDTDVGQFRECLAHSDYDGAALSYQGDLVFFGASVDTAVAHRLDAARATLRRDAEGLLGEPLSPATMQRLSVALGLEMSDVAVRANTRRAAIFVGRDDELRLLIEAWNESIEQRRASTVVVEGEPGIGKTALCDRFLRKIVLRGASMLDAVGAEFTDNLPYGIVSQLVADAASDGWLDNLGQPWKGTLARLHPSLLEVTSDDHPSPTLHQTALAFRQALACGPKSQSPLAIFVDNAHWMDPASMAILQFLVSTQTGGPLLLLLSRRSVQGSSEQFEWPNSIGITVHGLPDAEVEYLAKKRAPALCQDDVSSLKVLTRGNPLLLQAILASGFPLTALPPTAHAVYQREIAGLSRIETDVGGALAAAGCPLDEGTISELTDIPLGAVRENLRRLVDRRYLENESSGYRFTHGLVAEEFLLSLPAAKRALLHGRAGRLLQGRGTAPAVVAVQFAIAGSREEAFATALGAARASKKLHALAEAEHFYRIAVAHSGEPSEEVIAKAGLAELLMLRGKPMEARDLLRAALESNRHKGRDQAELDALFMIACSSTGFSHDSLRERVARLSQLKEHVSSLLLLRTYAAIAASAVDAGNIDVAVHCLDIGDAFIRKLEDGPDRIRQEVKLRCIRGLLQRDDCDSYPLEDFLSRTHDKPAARVDVLQAHAVVNIFNGRMDEAEESLVEALAISERYSVLHQYIALANNLGVCYLEQGRWEEAEHQLEMALASSSLSSRRELLSAFSNYAVLKWETSELQEALVAANRCLELRPLNESHRARVTGFAISGLVQLERGQLAAARAAEHQLRARLPVGKWWGHDNSYAEIFLARMAVTGGRLQDAVDRLACQLSHSEHLDFYSSARLEIELLRYQKIGDPVLTARRATSLRHRLAEARAVPLVERIDGVIARCETVMREGPGRANA